MLLKFSFKSFLDLKKHSSAGRCCSYFKWVFSWISVYQPADRCCSNFHLKSLLFLGMKIQYFFHISVDDGYHDLAGRFLKIGKGRKPDVKVGSGPDYKVLLQLNFLRIEGSYPKNKVSVNLLPCSKSFGVFCNKWKAGSPLTFLILRLQTNTVMREILSNIFTNQK